MAAEKSLGALFSEWLEWRTQPHMTTCEYCHHGHTCPCGEHVWCDWDEEWEDANEVFCSHGVCDHYREKAFPESLNEDE